MTHIKQTLIQVCAAVFMTALLCCPADPSQAATGGALMKGRTLALLCSSSKQDDVFSCQSYIAGVIDYHRLLKSLGSAPTVDFCIPETVGMNQIRAVVVNYMAKHSEHRDFIAAPGVAMSLFTAWPCAKRRR